MRQQRADGWIKRNDRQEVDLQAAITRAEGSTMAAQVTNISFEGCQLEFDGDLEIGECVNVALPGLGEIGAQVRWALPGKAGVCFLLDESQSEQQRSGVGGV